MPLVSARSHCRHHREALAGWSCSICRAKLCPDCVAEKRIDALCVDVCATCGDRVAIIVEHRADTSPYEERLRTIWRYPLSFGGIVGMCGTGVLFAIGTLNLAYLAVAFSVFWAFIFLLIQSTAQGDDDIGPPDFSTFWESVIQVLFRAAIASAASWVPLIFYVWTTKPHLYDALVNPIIWLFVVFGLVYAPIAFLGAAVRAPLWRILNPLWMIRSVAVLGRDYWLAIGVLSILFVAQCALAWLLAGILLIPIPFLPIAVVVTLLMYLPFLMARVVGLLLYLRGDKLEYGHEEDYFERVVKDRPRGVLPEVHPPTFDPKPDKQTPNNVRPIEVDF